MAVYPHVYVAESCPKSLLIIIGAQTPSSHVDNEGKTSLVASTTSLLIVKFEGTKMMKPRFFFSIFLFSLSFNPLLFNCI